MKSFWKPHLDAELINQLSKVDSASAYVLDDELLKLKCKVSGCLFASSLGGFVGAGNKGRVGHGFAIGVGCGILGYSIGSNTSKILVQLRDAKRPIQE